MKESSTKTAFISARTKMGYLHIATTLESWLGIGNLCQKPWDLESRTEI